MNESNLEELVPQLDGLTETQLVTLVKALETLLEKTKDRIAAVVKTPEIPMNPLVDNGLFQLHPQPDIDGKLLEETQAYLKTLKYHPSAARSNSPEIHLFGGQRYVYNKQSASIVPTPIQPDSLIGSLLSIMNKAVGASFNSVLIKPLEGCKLLLIKSP